MDVYERSSEERSEPDPDRGSEPEEPSPSEREAERETDQAIEELGGETEISAG